MLGSIYALVSLGLTLIYGMMRMVNFSQGQFFVLGSYIFYVISVGLGLNPVLAVIPSLIFTFILALIAERLVIKGTKEPVFATFALGIIIENAILIYFGPYFLRPPSIIQYSINLGIITYSASRTSAGLIGIAGIAVSFLIFKRTYFGKALRAIVQDRDAASLAGVNVDFVSMLGFCFAVTLAGLAGILITPLWALHPFAGGLPNSKAIACIVVGSLGSVKGAAVAGMIIGLTETFSTVYISAPYRNAFAYIIMIIVLVIRPEGLFGARQE